MSLSALIILLLSLMIYLFLAVLCVHCCMWAFPSCSEQGLLCFLVCGLLIVVASLVRVQAVGVHTSVMWCVHSVAMVYAQ